MFYFRSPVSWHRWSNKDKIGELDMKYFTVENVIFVCVIAGVLTAFAGLWCHNIAAFSIGIVVGGLLPIVVAEIWSE